MNTKCDPVSQVRFNGILYLSGNLENNDSLKFAGSTNSSSKNSRLILRASTSYTQGLNSTISGSVFPRLWAVELDKGIGSVTLHNNLKCQDTLDFKSGTIFLNGRTIELLDPVGAPSVLNHPWLKNERNSSRLMPVDLLDSGKVIYSTVYSTTVNTNPANIGIELTGPADFGSPISFCRGFKPQLNVAKAGVSLFFDLESPDYGLTSNTVSIKYYSSDWQHYSSGYLNPLAMNVFVSAGSDANWSPLNNIPLSSLVSSTISEGRLVTDLSGLSHPHIGFDGKKIRLTIADNECLNPPQSAFSADTLHLCAGSTFTLDAGNNSSIANSSLRWQWNTMPANFQQTLTVSPDTSYQMFKVLLKDVRGCTAVDSIVIAPAAPYPQITFLNHLNACLGDSVLIKDTVTISQGTFQNTWLFSDNSTLQTQQQLFKHKFSSAGNYWAQLTATSEHGCSSISASSNIVVYPQPQASFSFTHDCVTDAVSFSHNSVSNYTGMPVTGQIWQLGMGVANTSTLNTPVQTYSAQGMYQLQLIAVTGFGCRDTSYDSILIHPRNLPQFNSLNVCEGDTLNFLNQSSCNTGSCSYTWLFGDGSSSGAVSPAKRYALSGSYNVWLRVEAPVGCRDSVLKTVFVNHLPAAHFVSTSSVACVNEPVYFTNTSSVSSGSISSYLWNFGNSVSSNGVNGMMAYNQNGLYTVSLTAISDSGCVHQYSEVLLIHPQPSAHFSAGQVCLGQPTQFVNNSSGSLLSSHWHYGNNIVAASNLLTHNYVYPQHGTYAASLIVTDQNGCADTSTQTVSVLSSPVVNLGGSISTCGTSYVLDAFNPGSSYQWSPGAQQTQTVQASHSGTFAVVVTFSNGCSASDVVQLLLNTPVSPMLGSDTAVCGQFQLDAGYPSSNYLWSTTETSQKIMISGSGTFVVTVTDQNQCSGSDTIVVVVKPPAHVDLGKDTVMCKPKTGLQLAASGNLVNYIWNTSDTLSAITLSQSGIYWVSGEAPNGCTGIDTIIVTFKKTPEVDLGPDKQACGKILLDARNAGCDYLWSDGSQHQQAEFFHSGMAAVSVTDKLSGCTAGDSVDLQIYPLVKVFLGNDTSLCSNAGFSLDAGNPGHSYRWLSGDTTQSCRVDAAGLYGVTVTGPGGCSSSDFVVISVVQAPQLDIGPYARYICSGQPVTISSPQSVNNVWRSEKGFTSLLQTVNITEEGKYWLDINQGGCIASDTTVVYVSTNTIQAMFLASTMDTVNKPVQFVNLSQPVPLSQSWTFGDGSTSAEFSPVHTYVLPADFSVTLEVSSGYCTDRITKALSVLFRESRAKAPGPVASLELLSAKLFPNPGHTEVNIHVELNDAAALTLQVSDISGRVIDARKYPAERIHHNRLMLNDLAHGVYLLNIRAGGLKGEIEKTIKFIKTD